MNGATWRPNGTGGYTLNGATIAAELVKAGKTWIMQAAGRSVTLGRKASFDHAEAALQQVMRELAR